MPYYKPCPDCGANLDPGESCDCKRQKKNGLPDANQISPRKGRNPSPKHNIAQSTEFVKTLSVPVPGNPLRELRVSQNIKVKEMVSTVRQIFPGYDKHLQSKCEHSEVYGVMLAPEGMKVLQDKYAPVPQPKKPSSPDRHKLTKRVSCRLPDETYEKFDKYTDADGVTMQDWMSEAIGKYVKEKDRKVLYDRWKAAKAQEAYCKANHVPRFAPYDGDCHRCHKVIYWAYDRPDGSVTGITIEGAGKHHITECPHCRASFID